ncbi:hypothetical protein ACUN7V_17080 [Quadrisphaera oryzae]|uniref:hypothetical protein n=1 Tax=Quadrisphaera TaxID=317661 RepID=UPI00164827D6|nr:hypothetical protein [Quadrisphaera sp. RL12-1S]MBC3761831.1 hypothetical protein [Quadrisphaera sp. RL12-1S]
MAADQRRRCAHVLDARTVVLVIDRDGEVDYYATAAEAARDMEAIDVRGEEYLGVYGLDGEVYSVGLTGERHHEVPVLTATGQRDLVRLRELLQAAHARSPSRVTTADPASFVNARAMWEWDRRRLRWPRWLDRRLHGTAPALLPTQQR